MAPHRVVQHSSSIGSAAAWLAETSVGSWAAAIAAWLAAAFGHDPFTWALGMLVFASVLDYATGVATARAVPAGRRGAYNGERAARGRREKIITVLLLIGCRMMEGLGTEFGMLDIGGLFRWLGWQALADSPVIHQGGILTTIVTTLIAVEELASVYDHRLQNGGSRVLILEVVFSTLRAAQKFVLGRVASKVAAWAEPDAGDDLAGYVHAQRMMDEASHKATHGEPAPRRRAGDAADEDLAPLLRVAEEQDGG